MPMVLAASTISVPAGTVILWPSIVRLTSGMGGHGLHAAGVVEAVLLVLVVEVPHRRVDNPAGGVAEAAQAAAVLQRVRHLPQVLQLDLAALVRKDALVHPHGPIAADATRRALAARLVCVELEQPVRGADDAVRVVHHDHAAGTAHRLRW